MVYPHEHILLRFNGHFGSSGTAIADRWSCNVRMGLPASAPVYDAAKLQTLVNAAQTAGQTFHSGTNSATGTSTFFDQVAGAQIGVSGRYTPTGQLTVLSPLTPQAGIGTPIHPWNVASVFSLRTAIPRGRGSNGRVYWPAISLPVTATTGRVATGVQGLRVTAFKAFLDALNVAGNSYSAGMKVIVASNVGGGLIAYATSVRSDDRIDSIERRENDQPAVWSAAALA